MAWIFVFLNEPFLHHGARFSYHFCKAHTIQLSESDSKAKKKKKSSLSQCSFQSCQWLVNLAVMLSNTKQCLLSCVLLLFICILIFCKLPCSCKSTWCLSSDGHASLGCLLTSGSVARGRYVGKILPSNIHNILFYSQNSFLLALCSYWREMEDDGRSSCARGLPGEETHSSLENIICNHLISDNQKRRPGCKHLQCRYYI